MTHDTYIEIYFGDLHLSKTCGGDQMLVIKIIMITVMANSAYDTAMDFSETRVCLGAGQDANGAITFSKYNTKSLTFDKNTQTKVLNKKK